MTTRQVPPPDLAPTLPKGLTSEQCLALWVDLTDACEQLLLVGLRRQVGPDGDVWAAYRQWNDRQMEEHDRTVRHMLEELNRREGTMAAKEVLQALKQIWVSLEPFDLPMAVMGEMALSVWEHIRATRDVDLLVQLESNKVDKVLKALTQVGMRPKREPPLLQIGPVQILQLRFEPPGTFVELQIDLLFAGSDYQRQALARRVPARLPELDIEIFVLSCEDLILHKLIAGRILDRADVAALLRANRTNLAFDYLGEWISRLSLTTEWSETWEHAFPGEQPPGR